jgi:hypothetical protein
LGDLGAELGQKGHFLGLKHKTPSSDEGKMFSLFDKIASKKEFSSLGAFEHMSHMNM